MAGRLWAGTQRRGALGWSPPCHASHPWRRLDRTSCCLRGRGCSVCWEGKRPPWALTEPDGTQGHGHSRCPSHTWPGQNLQCTRSESCHCETFRRLVCEQGAELGHPPHARPSLLLEHGPRAGGQRWSHSSASAPAGLWHGDRDLQERWLLTRCWGWGCLLCAFCLWTAS